MGVALLGAPLLSATAGASTVGLLGAGGAFSLGAGSLFSSLGTIGTALSLGSTLFSAFSGSQQAAGERAAYDYNAQVAEQNAEIAKQNAAADLRDAERQRRLRLGANVARAGASGGLTGSALDVLGSNAEEEALYAASIRNAGLLQSQNFKTEAQLNRLKKKNVSSGVGATLLAGTADALSRFT